MGIAHIHVNTSDTSRKHMTNRN